MKGVGQSLDDREGYKMNSFLITDFKFSIHILTANVENKCIRKSVRRNPLEKTYNMMGPSVSSHKPTLNTRTSQGLGV
jgi:hypothetical protein